jgi:hypothetical protein
MTGATRTMCAQCRQELNGSLSRHPCPLCGSDARAVSVVASDQILTSDTIARIRTGYGIRRTWWKQWLVVQGYLRKLCEACEAGNAMGTAELDRRVTEFFEACWALRDWMLNDTEAPAATKQLLEDYVQDSEPLRVCKAFANVSKHLYLRNPEWLHARVGLIDINETRNAVSISSWSSVEPEKFYDALQLAKQCVAAWDRFIYEHLAGRPI